METKILVESFSPICDAEAYVEQDENTIYFYMYLKASTDDAVMKPCFICNVKSKAEEISPEEWAEAEDGSAPMLPYEYVTHSEDGMTLDAEHLRISWTKEGSGAGLFYNDELIAFIPDWADDEFPGYSAYVSGITPYAWSIVEAKESVTQRLAEAEEFWSEAFEDYWTTLQPAHITAIENYIGKVEQYFAIDGGKWPPKALVTAEDSENNAICGLTIGVSAFRQPTVELFYGEQTADFSRIEIGFACKKYCETAFMPILESISGAVRLPWEYITSLGHGHTLKLEDEGEFTALWLLNSHLLKGTPTPDYPPSFGDRVNLLWAVPITQEEYDFLLTYDMPEIFKMQLPESIRIFDGVPKGIKTLLSGS